MLSAVHILSERIPGAVNKIAIFFLLNVGIFIFQLNQDGLGICDFSHSTESCFVFST